MTESPPTERLAGQIRSQISEGVVALFKDFYGAGPTQAKTYLVEDLVVCVLRGGYTKAEQTLREAGRGRAVSVQRVEFQEVMRERFIAVVERATGRRVVAFMASGQQEPDMLCEVFVLASE